MSVMFYTCILVHYTALLSLTTMARSSVAEDGYWQGLAQEVDVELRKHDHTVPAIAVLPAQPSRQQLLSALRSIHHKTKGMLLSVLTRICH